MQSRSIQPKQRASLNEMAIILGPLVVAAAVLVAVVSLQSTPGFVRAIWIFIAIVGIPLQFDRCRQRLRENALTTQALTFGILLFLTEGAIIGALLVLLYQAP